MQCCTLELSLVACLGKCLFLVGEQDSSACCCQDPFDLQEESTVQCPNVFI